MLTKMKNWTTFFFKTYFLGPLGAAPIKKKRDFILYVTFLCFAGLCLIGGLVAGILLSGTELGFLMFVYSFFIGCFLPFMPKLLIITFRAGKTSYVAGKAATTREYVEIHQVSPTQYRATHEKQHDGALFAILGGIIAFFVAGLFYMWLSPLLLGYKIYKIAKTIYEYKRDMLAVGDEPVQS